MLSSRILHTSLTAIFLMVGVLYLNTNSSFAQVPPFCCNTCPSGCCGPTWPSYTIVQCQTDCNSCKNYIENTTEPNIENTVDNQHQTTQDEVTNQHNDTRQLVTDRHTELREFLLNTDSTQYDLFSEAILPALTDMTIQIDTMLSAKARAIGGFFDAQNHIQTQTTLSRLSAQSWKDYNPDSSLCLFGTQTKSLSASEHKSHLNKLVMGQPSFHNDLVTLNNAEHDTLTDPYISRRRKFETIYCDPADNNNRLSDWCVASAVPERYNKDLNYATGVDNQLRLDIDFADTSYTSSEEDIVSLINNLYGYNGTPRLSPSLLLTQDSVVPLADLRALLAKRNAAKNSLLSIASMKSNGSATDNSHISSFLENMGLSDDGDLKDIEEMIGTSPSYYAQMEILTKKAYQHPAFYTSLITEPTNIKRQRAAMQSVELMQQRDITDSVLRTEMLMSLLVELKLRDHQKEFDLRMRKLRAGGGEVLAP